MGRDSEMLFRAGHISESNVNELDILVLNKLQRLIGGVKGHDYSSKSSGSTTPW